MLEQHGTWNISRRRHRNASNREDRVIMHPLAPLTCGPAFVSQKGMAIFSSLFDGIRRPDNEGMKGMKGGRKEGQRWSRT